MVTLGKDARRTILDELRAYRHRLEAGEEVGGWLFQERAGSIDLASPLANGKSGHQTMELQLTDAFRVEAGYRRVGLPEIRTCGFWHAHPTSCSGSPSPADLRSWSEVLDHLEGYGTNQVYGVIVVAGPGGDWERPRFRAWRTYRPRPGQAPVCEEAALT